jgi:hypothetical protein
MTKLLALAATLAVAAAVTANAQAGQATHTGKLSRKVLEPVGLTVCQPSCHNDWVTPPFVTQPVGQLPESGPCYYHGGVVWIVPGVNDVGEAVTVYGCVDGTIIEIGDDYQGALWTCQGCDQGTSDPPPDEYAPDDQTSLPPSDTYASDDPCLTDPDPNNGCAGS